MLQDGQKLPPGGVRNGLVQPGLAGGPVREVVAVLVLPGPGPFRHVLDVQILADDDVGPGQQIVRRLEQKVPPLAADPIMGLLQGAQQLIPPPGPPRRPREPPLQLGQPVLQAPEVLRGLDVILFVAVI